MAGVKVTAKSWPKGDFAEIKFVGKYKFYIVTDTGGEYLWEIGNQEEMQWYLYEEPKPEVKLTLEQRIEVLETDVKHLAHALRLTNDLKMLKEKMK